MIQALEHTNGTPVPTDVSVGAVELAIVGGDFSKMASGERLKYLAKLCEWTGLNPLAKPFDYIVLNGKLTLYANKGCAEQLRGKHHITIESVTQWRPPSHLVDSFKDVYVVEAVAIKGDQKDRALGAVFIGGLRGQDLANAVMKAETKAKRRVTLSICGLGMPDESELTERGTRNAEQPTNILEMETAADRAEDLNKRLGEGTPERQPVVAELVSEPVNLSTQSRRADAGDKRTAKTVGDGGGSESAQQTQSAQTATVVEPTARHEPMKSPENVESRPSPGQPGLLPDDLVSQVENALGEHGILATRWMMAQNPPWLIPGQTLAHLRSVRANRIVKQRDSFIASLKTWAASQGK
jgi:hypothetical protein